MKVVITGATKGIGRAIAEKFAGAGHSIITCARTEKDLYEMANSFSVRFPNISFNFMATDIEDLKQVKKFGKWIIENDLTPDILVNNAGYFLPGNLHTEKDGVLEKMVAVNLYGPYNLIRALLPAMMHRRQGHIFNICSVASLEPTPNASSYSISKFALLGLTKNLQEEMISFGIKVTAVCPGATMSASWEGEDVDPGRLMQPGDIADMVFAASLMSPAAVVEDIIIRPMMR